MFRHAALAGPLLLAALLPGGPARAEPSYGDAGVAMSVPSVDCVARGAGQRCAVTVRLVDISDGVTVFVEENQLAHDASGRAYRPNPDATAAANPGRPVTRRLPRGRPVTSVLVYDLPAGARIDRVELHGNIGSPGESFLLR